METSEIIEKFEEYPKIPTEIEDSIINLFGVNNLHEINEKNTLAQKISGLFYGGEKTKYDKLYKEYTLYYLPMNFYKVWRPLMDLLQYKILNTKLNILELGVGPGSCTFGIIEFFRILALDNPNEVFDISFYLIEKEKSFVEIFNKLYIKYKAIFPKNLNVIIKLDNRNLNDSIEFDDKMKFDLIVESNMLNQNEQISKKVIENLVGICTKLLKPHSSIILIEPAGENAGNYLQKMKKRLMELSFACFSPCFCKSGECKQFAAAKTYIGKSQIIQGLRKMKSFSEIKPYHYYEYAVLRNDGLVKYKSIDNKVLLKDIGSKVGEEISFKAFILASSNREKKIVLKICDGSLCERKDIWIEIPKAIIENNGISDVDVNRGEFIEVKQAKIIGKNNILCELHSKIKIMR